MVEFKNENGTICSKTEKYYNSIKKYAKRYKLKNTKIALDLAIMLHQDQFRDGGAPYIIHPLEATNYLILLGIWSPIFKMELDSSHDESLAEELAHQDLDILLAAMLLHDTLEDCKDKLSSGGNEFVDRFGLHPDVLLFVQALTKNKDNPNFSNSGYYEYIGTRWQTSIMKIADRLSNCSTIDSFNTKQMEKYVREIVRYFYPMISRTKDNFPSFSRVLTIMKYLIVSITETVAAVLNLDDVLTPDLYEKTYYFIKGFAVAKDKQNTLKALSLARMYYEGYTRKSGDPFIIHPLRVASYLIALKIDDDEIIAAALLHEIIKKCHLAYNGIEILTQYRLSPKVLDYVRLLANSEQYPLDIYYSAMQEYPEVLLLKLSNRAHTCTSLVKASDINTLNYLNEWKEYIVELGTYGAKHYPAYSNSIKLMCFQIDAVCNIVSHLKPIKS